MAQQTYGEYMRSNPPIPNLTAVEWLVQKYFNDYNVLIPELEYEQAKQMEKEQMVKFAEFVASHPDKNKNYLGEMLHAKSKYDGAERTVDLLEQYYNETYGNKS
jgi:hypothetical protein